MALKGDFKKLGQLAENLRRLAELPDETAKRVAPELARLTQEQFDAGTNPYGRAWAGLAPSTLAKGRTPPPLTDTRAMRNSVEFVPRPGEGLVGLAGFPAGIHQAGSPKTKLPARQIFPAGTFPRTWRTAIEKAAHEVFVETMRKDVA